MILCRETTRIADPIRQVSLLSPFSYFSFWIFFLLRRFFYKINRGFVWNRGVVWNKRKIFFKGGLFLISLFSSFALLSAEEGEKLGLRKLQDSELNRLELQEVEENIHQTQQENQNLEKELGHLKADEQPLQARLFESSSLIQSLESKMSDIEEKLQDSQEKKEKLEQSIGTRRHLVIEILSALQRLGRNPPPAVLVQSDNILRAIRTSLLFNTLLPQLHLQIKKFAEDLGDLVIVNILITQEKNYLSKEKTLFISEKEKLMQLVNLRQKNQIQTEDKLKNEQNRLKILSQQAADLRDLIMRLEKQETLSEHFEESEGKKAPSLPPLSSPPQEGQGIGKPILSFASLKGGLSFPVAGHLIRKWGMRNAGGNVEKGVSLLTRAQALVTSPAQGVVVFAGSYRSYGQILILSVGEGYYIVLAGMDRILINRGQSVLTGEPIAFMGHNAIKTPFASPNEESQPVLYIEFRKDGIAIDSESWWTKSEFEKVRG